jgi:hypothetical protein
MARVALLALLVIAGASAARARGAPDRAAAVKAAFVLNFAKLVRWPAAQPPSLTFDLCATDPAALGGALAKVVAGRDVDDRPVRVVHLRPTDADVAARCRLLFVGATADRAAYLALVDGKPVLTVSDGPGFARAGGMIELVVPETKVRFVLNLGAARRGGLVLGAHLGRMAVDVVE